MNNFNLKKFSTLFEAETSDDTVVKEAANSGSISEINGCFLNLLVAIEDLRKSAGTAEELKYYLTKAEKRIDAEFKQFKTEIKS